MALGTLLPPLIPYCSWSSCGTLPPWLSPCPTRPVWQTCPRRSSPLATDSTTGALEEEAEVALDCREMGHELVTCWVVASTNSIAGWCVQGACKHPARVRAGSTLMFPEIAPHILRETSSRQRLPAATALDVLSDPGRWQGRGYVLNPQTRNQGCTAWQSPHSSPWVRHFTFLGLSVLPCPMGKITVKNGRSTTNNEEKSQHLAEIKQSTRVC